MKCVILAVAVAGELAGCANPGIVPMSQDTYMLSRTDHGGIFGNAAAMKADVITEANAFAQARGKVAIPIASHEQPLIPGVRFASIEYQFKLVDPGDPSARGASLQPAPLRIETKSEVTTHDTARPDIYTELLKLDDLHKRGILTDAEFEEQKHRLLERK